jgi:4-amino-4-deoxy-L-arabinose transferase-like glycosyltransferase
MRTNISLFLIAVIATAMITGVHYNYLWGPDEPRDAEIAREMLADGNWVTPHLCGLPFLEKPPLYYNVVACAYALTGKITPTVARSVSVLFGMIMLGATFVLGYRWRGVRAGWFIVLVLLTMLRFWKYSHWILLDIAVGAFSTCALVCFACATFRTSHGRKESVLIYLFALFSSLTFLTKGLAGFFSIALVVGAFCLLARRGGILKKIFSPAPLLVFFVPVAFWVILYYRDGGSTYLYELFINNTIGRLLQLKSALPITRAYDLDFGPQHPWYYYIQVLPEIMGPWILALPFALWQCVRTIKNRSEEWNGTFSLFILIWAFLPVFVLSFSSVKERTYILPSYPAIAALVGCWLDTKLLTVEKEIWKGVGWFWMVFPFVLLSLLFSHLSPVAFIVIAVCMVLVPLIFLIRMLVKRRFTEGTYLFFSILLCFLITISTPNVLFLRYERLCYIPFAVEALRRAGDHPLYIYQPRDTLRGTIPFCAKRTILELDRAVDLRKVLEAPSQSFVVMRERVYKKFVDDRSLDGLLFLSPPGNFRTDPDYVLVTNRKN